MPAQRLPPRMGLISAEDREFLAARMPGMFGIMQRIAQATGNDIIDSPMEPQPVALLALMMTAALLPATEWGSQRWQRTIMVARDMVQDRYRHGHPKIPASDLDFPEFS